jgi:hypothetical protein
MFIQNIRMSELNGVKTQKNAFFYNLQHILKPVIVNRISDIKICKIKLEPFVRYVCGCETWSMTEKDEVMLNTWERKILRKLYGPATEQGAWRIRTNQELWKLCKTPECSNVVG